LRDLVQEAKATGPTYRITLRTVIRNSYKGHYRWMVPQILKTLDFRSNNRSHRPVIQALDLLKRYADTRLHNYPADEDVPIDGVARGLWREAVVETDAEGHSRVNRITYEFCVLDALRDKLRCKEVWVVGAIGTAIRTTRAGRLRGATNPVLPGVEPAARSRSLHRRHSGRDAPGATAASSWT
jgi:hypothetical protein